MLLLGHAMQQELSKFKIFVLFNPLLHEVFFWHFFEIQPKIGCHRLPIHRYGAHFLILKSKCWPNVVPIAIGHAMQPRVKIDSQIPTSYSVI